MYVDIWEAHTGTPKCEFFFLLLFTLCSKGVLPPSSQISTGRLILTDKYLALAWPGFLDLCIPSTFYLWDFTCFYSVFYLLFLSFLLQCWPLLSSSPSPFLIPLFFLFFSSLLFSTFLSTSLFCSPLLFFLSDWQPCLSFSYIAIGHLALY